MKTNHHHNFLLSKKYKRIITSIGVFFIFIGTVFFITRGVSPHVSELAFVSHSTLGKDFGSVVPASCDSVPVQSHFVGDVDGCLGSVNCPVGLTFNRNLNECVCTNGSALSTRPACNLPPKVDVAFSTGANPFIQVTFTSNYSGSINKVPRYGNATLTWSTTNSTAVCTKSGSWSGSTVGKGPWSVNENYAGTGTISRTYTLSCTVPSSGANVSKSITVYFVGESSGGGGGCFVAGTQITMEDGTSKSIEKIQEGEVILSSGGQQIVAERIVHPDYEGELFALNGSANYFVTPNHPFMTTEGWKSFDPKLSNKENPSLNVSQLKIGDTLLQKDGSSVVLHSFDKKFFKGAVYNLEVEGTHDYYANGYWVHNKMVE